MSRCRFLPGLMLWALAASVCAQGIGGPQGGGFGPSDNVPGPPGVGKGSRDSMRPPSNPGIAPPLDIRIQGEGISLPPGVSGDEPVGKPAEDRAPQRSAPPDDPSKPGAKRP